MRSSSGLKAILVNSLPTTSAPIRSAGIATRTTPTASTISTNSAYVDVRTSVDIPEPSGARMVKRRHPPGARRLATGHRPGLPHGAS